LLSTTRAREQRHSAAMAEPAGLTFVGMGDKIREYSFHITLFCTSAALTTAGQLFAPLSKNDDGQYEYATQAAVFMAELLKLILASSMLLGEGIMRHMATGPPPAGQPPLLAPDPLNQIARYFVPALLWFANNNITFYVLQGISPSTNQAIGQSKIIFTIVLLYVFLGRRFNLQQMLSLAILACALVIMATEDSATQHSSGGGGNSTSSGHSHSHQTYPLSAAVAVLLSLTIAFNGSLAGVYNEKLLKELRSCIHYQNIIAYVYGCIFNFAFMYINENSRRIVTTSGLLGGFNTYSWLYVFSTGTMGLSVSFMYKYQDNIARIMAIATSIALTLILSVPCLDQDVNIASGTAVVVIALTLLAYYDGAEKQKVADKEREQRVKLAPKEGTGLLANAS